MEALDQMLTSGWQQQRAAPPGVNADVSLSLTDPHAGRSALRLQAWPADAARVPRVIERPIVWIASSPVPIREGQLVRIRGWVHVPRPIGGSDEGLLLFDSLGGPDLGDRIRLTQGWREFTLYRAVPRTGELIAHLRPHRPRRSLSRRPANLAARPRTYPPAMISR